MQEHVPPILDRPPQASPGLAVLLLLVGAAPLAVLFLFNPAQSAFYPFCLFHKFTGYQCPGCGSLRALHQVLHGNLLEALRLNALLVLTLPFWIWVAGRTLASLLGWKVHPLRIGPGWLWGSLILVLAFGILRNL